MKYVLRLAILMCSGAAFAASVDGVPNFQKVNDGLYRGGQPTKDGFEGLARLGVKTIVDLRLPDEHSGAQEKKWVESLGMRYVNVPLKGLSAPSSTDVAKILAIFNDPSSGPVFVHCRRGADRTGTIVACYRISHDRWENRKALDEARGYGMRFWERSMQNYVMHYTAPAAADSAVAAQ